jgi:hypothetical protein
VHFKELSPGVQLAAPNTPADPLPKATTPEGANVLPELSESMTIAVQLTGAFTIWEEDPQVRLNDVSANPHEGVVMVVDDVESVVWEVDIVE